MKLKRMIISVLVILLVCKFSAFSSGQDETSEVGKEQLSNQTDFVVVGHQVHQRVTSQGAGGNITAEWAESAGVENVEWMTMGVSEISERLGICFQNLY